MGPGEITLKDDPRILPFGKFLRKAKLNELPQLINIFKRRARRQAFTLCKRSTQSLLVLILVAEEFDQVKHLL